VSTTDASDNILWREDYKPFGDERQDSAGNDDDRGFTGHVFDDATGLSYMQARYYYPVVGRFLSNDPVGFAPQRPEMFSRYAYADNDPINRRDPNGMQSADLQNARNERAFLSGEMSKERYNEIIRVRGIAGLAAASLVVPGPEDAIIAVAAARWIAVTYRITQITKMINNGGRLVLYSSLGRGPTLLKAGDFILGMSKRFWSIGSNRRIIAAAMRARKPIGDSHVNAAGGLIRARKGTALLDERKQLRAAGWRFNKKAGERSPRRVTCTGSRIPRSSC